MKKYILSEKKITTDLVADIALNSNYKFQLSSVLKKKILSSLKYVDQIAFGSNEAVYGINTGFGALSNKKISPKDLSTLQINLIRSHCTGVGEPFSESITRALMFLRVHCLAQGFSGVKLETIELILKMLEYNILPIIPQQGSVGASGDLAPLAHMALALIGEGDVIFSGKKQTSSKALKSCGLQPLSLGPKEGLALINGTNVMAALGSLAVFHAKNIAEHADLISAYTLDSIKGSSKPFDELIQLAKPHPGQIKVASNLRKYLHNSQVLNSHHQCQKVQDPYSLRCIPQVHGACRQTIIHAEEVLNIEINSITDNPLIFVDENKILSGGNFHGEAVAMVMDYLAIGLSEFANISERRIEKMMNPSFSELPAFLTKNPGLNSGLMIAQVTAAALASENKYLCHPSSVDSIPTSTDKEDHVSMGLTSGRKLHSVIENVYSVLAIELLCASQALEFSRPLKSSSFIEYAHKEVRKLVPIIKEDRVLSNDINSLNFLIKSKKLFN